jgi:hypothetical protein
LCLVPKVRNKTRIPTLTTSIEHNTLSPRQSNEAKKEKLEMKKLNYDYLQIAGPYIQKNLMVLPKVCWS